jgi:hypothetical protein
MTASTAMQHYVTYPLVAHPYHPELMTKQAIVRFAKRAEELGVDGVGFTVGLPTAATTPSTRSWPSGWWPP